MSNKNLFILIARARATLAIIMRNAFRLFRLWCTGTTIAIGLAGCDRGDHHADANPSTNRLICNDATFDFGNIRHSFSSPMTHRFVLENNSDQEVRITGIAKSCGCADATISDRTVPPHGKCSVEMSVDYGSRVGAQSVSAIVSTDHPLARQILLQLKSNIQPLATIEPLPLIFDNVAPGEKQSRIVKIKIDDPAERLDVTSIKSPSNNILISKLDQSKNPVSGSEEINFRVTAIGEETKVVQDRTIIFNTSNEMAQELPLRVIVRSKGFIEPSPGAVVLTPTSRSILVRVRYPADRSCPQFRIGSSSEISDFPVIIANVENDKNLSMASVSVIMKGTGPSDVARGDLIIDAPYQQLQVPIVIMPSAGANK